jgi:hypothetical protein
MFFVIDKPGFQRVLSIVRDDRTKEMQGLDAPFLRLEAKDDCVKLDGLTVSAKFAATVYEAGVLFLKVTTFRRLLRTVKAKFLSIQVTAKELVMDSIHMGLEPNEWLMYADPDRAPMAHPSVTLAALEARPEPPPQPEPPKRQLPFWLEWKNPPPDEMPMKKTRAKPKPRKPERGCPFWLIWPKPGAEPRNDDK